MKQDSWDSLNDEQKFIVADNTIIEFLTPEELEALSKAEQAAEDAKATQSALWEKVKGRNVSDWREREGSETAEILSRLDPVTREFARFADADELIEFAEAYGVQAETLATKQKFHRIAARRMKQQ
jgi:hypothetical protein